MASGPRKLVAVKYITPLFLPYIVGNIQKADFHPVFILLDLQSIHLFFTSLKLS